MKLADRLNSGKPSFTAWSGVPDSMTIEIVANTGFDIVTLDMQHGGHHEDSVLRGIAPIRSRRGPRSRRPAKLHADKGYDHDHLRR